MLKMDIQMGSELLIFIHYLKEIHCSFINQMFQDS